MKVIEVDRIYSMSSAKFNSEYGGVWLAIPVNFVIRIL